MLFGNVATPAVFVKSKRIDKYFHDVDDISCPFSLCLKACGMLGSVFLVSTSSFRSRPSTPRVVYSQSDARPN